MVFAAVGAMLRVNYLLAIVLTGMLALPAAPARAVHTVSAPHLVKEINPASVWGSAPSQMTAVGDTLFFETARKQSGRPTARPQEQSASRTCMT
jgi:hypothetical protein